MTLDEIDKKILEIEIEKLNMKLDYITKLLEVKL